MHGVAQTGANFTKGHFHSEDDMCLMADVLQFVAFKHMNKAFGSLEGSSWICGS